MKTFFQDTFIKHKLLLALGDALSLGMAFFLSFTLRNYFFYWRGGVYYARMPHLVLFLGLVVLIFFYFRHSYLYRDLAFRPTLDHLEILTRAWLSFVAIFIVISFFLKVQLFLEHRISLLLFVVLGWVGLYINRFVIVPRVAARYFLNREFPENVLIVGLGTEAQRIAGYLQDSPVRQVQVVGYVDDTPSGSQDPPEDLPLLGRLQDLAALVQAHEVKEVFVHLGAGQERRITEVFGQLKNLPVRIRIALAHFGALKEKVPKLPEVEQGFVFLNKSTFQHTEQVIKRMIDVVGAALGLVCLAPVFFVLGLLVKLDSPGPVFFRQKRAGRDGREFAVFKFRTMRVNTEAQHREAIRRLVQGDEQFFEEQTGRQEFFKATDSKQVTRVGGFLRRTSLDELPQIINVLRGEMSLVGPRPLPLYEVELLKDWQQFRHNMQPGITGFWQVFGRSVVSHDNMMLMDIYYIANWSLALDIRILARTFFVVLTGKGAL